MTSSSASPSPRPSSITSKNSSSSATTPSSETHSCPYNDCHKSFSKKYNLKAHLRLHTGEEPFECDRPDCRKKFKWRSSLSSHSVWHTRKDAASGVSKPVSSHSTTPATPVKPSSTPTSTSAECASRALPSSVRRKRPRCESEAWDASTAPSSASSASTSHPHPTVQRKRRAKRSSANMVKTPVITTEHASQLCSADDHSNALDKPEVQLAAPGSPVTSDGSTEEEEEEEEDVYVDDEQYQQAHHVEEAAAEQESVGVVFNELSCDLLEPLLARNDGLVLDGADDMPGMIDGETDGLFGFEDASACAALNGFDSRFEQFDLDTFPTFCLG